MTPVRAVAAVIVLVVVAGACGSDGGSSEPLGSPALPSSGAVPGASVTPGQAIWVAVLAQGADADTLQGDLTDARAALGEYLAERVVVKEASCYEGVGEEVTGSYVVAIQDVAEHGVHAMFLEITDDPVFYGPVTLAC